MNNSLNLTGRYRSIAVCVALIVGLLVFGAPRALAVSPDIVISQVYGGGGNAGATYTHDFVEIFNRGATSVSLAGWSIQYASATGSGNFGATSAQITELPNVSVAPGQYFLVQEAQGSGGTTPLPTPDLTDLTPIAMSGTGGKVALVNSNASLGCNGGSTPCSPAQLAQIVDLVGWDGANFFEGSPAPATANTTAALRANNGCTDTDNNGADFIAAAPSPRNSAALPYVCALASTNPSGTGAASPAAVSPGAQTLLTVAVTPGGNPPSTGLAVSADLSSIGGSAAQTFFDDGSNGDATAGDNTFSFLATVSAGAGGKSLSATITDAEGRSGNVSIALLVAPLTAIHDIQGANHTSPFNGQVVMTVGIVTAVAGNGFYLQTPDADIDGDSATSEGMFVFTAAPPGVAVGDGVQATGTVSEFQPGGPSSQNLTITELDNPDRTVMVLTSGNTLPGAIVIGTGGRIPPTGIIEDDSLATFDPNYDGLDFYESLEAMLVQVNDAQVVGPTNAFGEIWVVGDNGANVADADALTPRGGIRVTAADFNPERIQLDDTLFLAPVLGAWPQVDVGTRFPGAVSGVVSYAFGNYEVLVTSPVAVEPLSAVQREITPLTGDPSRVTVATFNVENLAGNAAPAEFATRANLIVNHLLSPDILVLEEMQDNNGATDDGMVDAGLTFANLIAAIQTAGGPAYAYQQINPVNLADGGVPGGNIRVGFLYNPARVTFVPGTPGDATTPNSIVCAAGQPSLALNPGRIDPTNPSFADSRKPLAGQFSFDGEALFVVGVHFSSKGGDDPLYGNVQPPFLYTEAQRIGQAQAVNDFVSGIVACDPNANVIVLGDVNDFEFSAPVAALKGAILTNLMELLAFNEQYSYVFEGNSQVLDQAVASANLYNESNPAYDVVHVNAEFTVQVSDHDPSVARFCLGTTPPVVTVSLSPNVLWPANHKLVDVSVAVTVDGAAAPVTLVSVTSNEPDNGLGDGDTADDIVIVDDLHLQLRAERAGGGAGRIYTATYQAVDGCGNVGTGSATVSVPKSQGQSQGKQDGQAEGAGGIPAAGQQIFLPLVRN